MTVSQSGSFDSDAMADKLMYERKSTLEHMEPEEQDTMKHSIRLVTGWMENRYRWARLPVLAWCLQGAG